MTKSLAIGLFAGSFNPAHSGHLHLARTAFRALDLDRVWWMPTPQNPLKPHQPPYNQRAASILALDLPPRMELSHAERDLDTRYTIDTLRALRRCHPAHRFVLLMGADNLAQLPKWKDWQAIFATVPIAVVSRPGPQALRARLGRAARQFAHARVPESAARTLAQTPPPAWVFLTAPLNAESSSRIRAATSALEPRLDRNTGARP